jgi:hypothetical protein
MFEYNSSMLGLTSQDYSTMLVGSLFYFIFPLAIGFILKYVFDLRTLKKEKRKWPRFLNELHPIKEVSNKIWETRLELFGRNYLFIIVGFGFATIPFFISSLLIILTLSAVWILDVPFKEYVTLGVTNSNLFITPYLNLLLIIPLGLIRKYIKKKNIWIKNPVKWDEESKYYFNVFSMIMGVCLFFIYGINYIAINAYAENLQVSTEIPMYKLTSLVIQKLFVDSSQNWDALVIIQLIGMIIAFSIIIKCYLEIISVHKIVKKLIINQYINDFPFLRVKTFTDKTEGQIVDAFDGELITLNDKGIKRTICWDRIEYVEIIENKNEQKHLHEYV